MSIAEILDTMEYGPAPESDKEARDWIKGLGGETRLFIGGQWKKAKSGASFETIAPATGEVLARIAQANAADVDAAVKAAARAQPAWAALSGHGDSYQRSSAYHSPNHDRNGIAAAGTTVYAYT